MTLAKYGLIPHTSKTVKPGDVFGRLTVLQTGKPPGTYRYQAVCRCECGTEKAVRVDALRSGVTVSCGCYHQEVITKHGLSVNPLYNVWKNIIDRCYNPRNFAFHNYGGRGITVCHRWYRVENFVADMEAGYQPDLEIDRIDNDGQYSPANCHWVTRQENTDNRRSRIELTFNGKTQSLARWSEETGIAYGTLWERLRIWRWGVERVLTTPPLSATERMQRARRSRWGWHEKK